MMDTCKMPEKAKNILEVLNLHGYEAYVVGGCVRDMIMGETPHDWDITTSAIPEQVKACFAKNVVLDTGIKHGTVTVVLGEQSFEVTTFRADGTYSDHRHPDSVQFTPSLTEDLARRDFTMNAIAMDIHGNLFDPFNGCADIQNNIIRCVGDPDKRFREDALRILRAMRFASRLGFRIEDETATLMKQLRMLIPFVSPERIQKEFVSILCGEYAYTVLRDYRAIIAAFIPEIGLSFDFEQHNPSHCYDVYEHILHSVDAIRNDPILRLTMFFHDIGKPLCHQRGTDGIDHFRGHASVSADITKSRMEALRFDNDTINAVTYLVKQHDVTFQPASNFVLRMLNKMGEEQFRRLLEVRKADIEAQSRLNYQPRMDKVANVGLVLKRVLAEQKAFKIRDLAVNGDDLIAMGMKPGPKIGEMLNQMLSEVIEGNLSNTKGALLQFAEDKIY